MPSLWSTRSDIPLIDRVRIQAEVLVPLVRELRAELGEPPADEVLRRTLGPMFREIGRRYVTSCEYAQLFHELGEPELGFRFFRSSDGAKP